MKFHWILLSQLLVLSMSCDGDLSKGEGSVISEGEKNTGETPEDKTTKTEEPEGKKRTSTLISPDKDGEWVRIDSGGSYMLSGQSLTSLKNKTDTFNFDRDETESVIFQSALGTRELSFINDGLARVEETSRSGQSIRFYLLRQGIETASFKGQLNFIGDSAEGNSMPEIILKNKNDSEKTVRVNVAANGELLAENVESGTYDIEIGSEGSEKKPIVVKSVRIENKNHDAGIFTLNHAKLNFKSVLQPQSNFSFQGQRYEAKISVQNLGDAIATGVNYKLESADPGLTIEGTQGILDSIPGGTTKTISFTYSFHGLSEPYKLMKLNILLRDTEGNEWRDHAYIEGWKKKFRLNFASKNPAGYSGMAIFENRRIHSFSVSTKETIELPEIVDGNYKFALSAKSLDEETIYSVGVMYPANSSFADFTETGIFEPNNSQEKATNTNPFTSLTSYLHVGDIDFFAFSIARRIVPEGDGTQANPYVLTEPVHLDYLSSNSDLITGHMKLGADLDLSNRKVGFWKVAEDLHFNGNGHSISNLNLTIDHNESFGFFTDFRGLSVVENLVVKDFDFKRTLPFSESNQATGALFGHFRNGATVRNVVLQNISIDDSLAISGGMAGSVSGVANIERIRIRGARIRGGHHSNVGGLAGKIEGILDFETNASKIEVVDSEILSGNHSRAGGIFGYAYRSYAYQCHSNATITGGVDSDVGGLVGHAQVGGFHDSAAHGSVTGTIAGGLAGWILGQGFHTSYAIGQVVGSYEAGGLIGGSYSYYSYYPNSTLNSYWNITSTGQTSSTSSSVSYGLTPTQMQDPASYNTWDFDQIWNPPQPGSYPTLRWLDP